MGTTCDTPSRVADKLGFLGQFTRAAAMAALLLIICVLLAAVVAHAAMRGVLGGAARRPAVSKPPPQHIVVDTLNLAHWLFTTRKNPVQMSTATIVDTVAKTAGIIRKQFPGRVMYVVKDRESSLSDPETRKAYAAAARDHSVYIEAVEQYEDPPGGDQRRRRESHAARGRDDMYAAILAKKYKCSVLTEDRFRDFDQFRKDIMPFLVYEYSFYKDLPDKDYVNPQSGAYRLLKKPFAIRYMDVLAELRPELQEKTA